MIFILTDLFLGFFVSFWLAEFGKKIMSTQSRKGQLEQKKYLLLGPPKSKNLGNFLQHMQKSKCFSDVFWRNCDIKFFPYKNQSSRMNKITKASC